MNTKHTITITGPSPAANLELALALRRLLNEAGGEADISPNGSDAQIVVTCDPEAIRGQIELAINEG